MRNSKADMHKFEQEYMAKILFMLFWCGRSTTHTPIRMRNLSNSIITQFTLFLFEFEYSISIIIVIIILQQELRFLRHFV